MVKILRKRDGSIAEFDQSKITNAIFKAANAVGGRDRKLAQKLSDKVVAELEKLAKATPSVEEIQDTVERVLIGEGHAATAKAYILYRQQRAEIRKEKQLVLEKEEVDEVDKRFDVNALRVLKARYLRKDATGKLIETPKQLFTRVAVHAALPDLFYDARVFDIKAQQPVNMAEDFKPALHEDQFSIGGYKLNRYHLEALKRMYDRFNRNKQMKVSWSKFFDMLRKGEFSSYDKNIGELFNLMTHKLFMPNTPAIANFGNPLGMGSACFHPNQAIMTEKGPKEIKDIKVGDLVLTHKGRFRKVEKVYVRNTDSLYKVSCSKLPKPSMLVTEEHPILSYKDNKIQWLPLNSLKEGDYVALSCPKEVEDVEQIKVSDIVKNVNVNEKDECSYKYKGGKFDAFVHTTKPVKNTIIVDNDVMKLFGYYLSEGSIADKDCVRFTFSIDEEAYCQEVTSIMEKKFGISSRIERTNSEARKWLSLRFHSTILANFFENILGRGYNKKHIPHWIMKLPQHKQKGLMAGLIRGDGTIFKNSNKTNARLVMCNQNVVYAFWQMTMRCGVFAALGKESMPKLGSTQPYRCTISGEQGLLLINELYGRQETDTGYKPNTFVVNDVIFTKIENILKIEYVGPVYNLEVQEDHSYVANMVSVHNCFVLDVPDSIDGIMETLKNTAIVFKAGGGMGYNFSKLRPEGDFVSSTGGIASGPISFMRLFDTMTEVIKQGGIRRGANMGILNSNHPDIERFITAKEGNKALRNFNISVLIMSDFWDYYEKNEPYPLINPKDGKVVRHVNPRVLFDKIVYQAWESAEPGVIFFDKVNDYNPFYEHLGPIVTTNPCGEVLLYPNEPCNLGSINVWAFAKQDEEGNTYLDWDGLREVTMKCTKFLDNVIDVNNFPLKAIEEMSLSTRKIGLGVMGVGDLLYEMRLGYNTEEGRKFMEQLMEFIAYWSKIESIELARTRGNLPYYDKSFYKQGRLPIRGADLRQEWHFEWDKLKDDVKKYGIRNGYTTIIAPTGSISMIAGCSSGMEPVYSLVFEKNVKVGSFYYVDPAAEKVLREEGLYNDKLMEDINANKGVIQNIGYVPERIREVLVTAMDITPEDHIRALASFQKWVDSSISKTNNFPADATVEHMRESYILAYRLGCKDVTVFRDTSIKDQVLVAPKAKERKEEVKVELKQPEQMVKESESGLVFAGESDDKPKSKFAMKNCPECGTLLEIKEGCLHCPGCGWGLCM
ncbi:adenosylcobalamin-dependent ribonucleoside-diphosphate reductase [Candidatus Woesearchaeota archaeon]|nr:adenosylcobalamin-dependent ribonucleoside-diphosphate reductase [Candidatus Woesearchaeota archaeon]